MENGEMPMTYLDPIPTFGDRVWVPDQSHPKQWIAIITTEANNVGRVRIDWDDDKQHHWGFYSQIELKLAEPDPREVSGGDG